MSVENRPPFVRQFPVKWRTDRDVECPVLLAFFNQVCPASLYDFGACYSDQTYLPEILPKVSEYMGIDLQPSEAIRSLIKTPSQHYVVADFNTSRLFGVRDMVICVSTVEHVGVFRPGGMGVIQTEQDVAFERCLEMASSAVFLSFPVGSPNLIPGEFSTITGSQLDRWEYRLRPYTWVERFFFSEGPQGGHPWAEHYDREFALTRKYVTEIGNQSICVLEILK